MLHLDTPSAAPSCYEMAIARALAGEVVLIRAHRPGPGVDVFAARPSGETTIALIDPLVFAAAFAFYLR